MKVSLGVEKELIDNYIWMSVLLSVLDNKNGSPYLFYQRQFWSCVKVCADGDAALEYWSFTWVRSYPMQPQSWCFFLFLVAGQHLDVGWHLIHILPEGPGSGQHSEQIHPLSTADHGHRGRERPKVPKGGKHAAHVRANTLTVAASAVGGVLKVSMASCAFIQVVECLPALWFSGLKGQQTLPQLEPLCRYLAHLANSLHRSSLGTSDLDRRATK